MGLAAAGAAGMPALQAQDSGAGIPPKMWNVSASLRGFYDDNYAVANNAKGSFGFEVSPSVSANVDLRQTDIGVRYTFGMYYYQQRNDAGLDPIDYTHTAEVWLDHSFTERMKLTVSDSLVIAQDPSLLQGGAPIRVNGDNIANRLTLKLNNEWTRQFSTETHYGNSAFIYSDTGTNNPANPSAAALLNRLEQNAGIDFQWHFQPETMGYIGYNFSWVRYDGNQEIYPSVALLANGLVIQLPPGPVVLPPGARQVKYYSDSRDYDSHYAYLGVSHTFSPNLSVSARGGASYTDSFNDPISPSTSLSPYADVSGTYTYMPGCYVQAGFTQDINSTDVVQPGANGHLTQYQQSSVFYFDVNHRFTPKLSGALTSQYQYSSYQDGASGNTGDSDVGVGISFNYQINRHLSAEAGYNFDELLSSIASRGNTRNRVYLGLTANY